MNFKKTFLLAASLGVALTTNLSAAMSDSDLALKMRKEVSPHLITLKKPRLFFHWVDASDITPKGEYDSQFPINSAQFANYVDKQGSKILNKRSDRDNDIAGPGLYMASDPLVSRSYGGEKRYGLVVGLLKTNTKLLAGNLYHFNFSKEVSDEIEKRGCTNLYGLIDLLDTTDANCTKIKQLLVGKNRDLFQGRLYTWSTQARSLPGCQAHNISNDLNFSSKDIRDTQTLDTIVIYSKEAFSEIYGYTHKSSVLANASLGNNILSYLKALPQTSAKFKQLSEAQYADSKITKMADADLKQFTKKYIHGCN